MSPGEQDGTPWEWESAMRMRVAVAAPEARRIGQRLVGLDRWFHGDRRSAGTARHGGCCALSARWLGAADSRGVGQRTPVAVQCARCLLVIVVVYSSAQRNLKDVCRRIIHFK